MKCELCKTNYAISIKIASVMQLHICDGCYSKIHPQLNKICVNGLDLARMRLHNVQLHLVGLGVRDYAARLLEADHRARVVTEEAEYLRVKIREIVKQAIQKQKQEQTDD